MRLATLAVVMGLALAGCAEKSETGQAISFTPAYMGSGTNFVVEGWTPGDRNSWVAQLKTRTIRGQHEHPRIQ